MARAYPHMQALEDVSYVFPWGQETFLDFLAADSPWLLPRPDRISRAFGAVAGEELTAHSLSAFCRSLELAYEKANGLGAYDWKSLALTLQINGVKLIYCTGADHVFPDLLERCGSADLVIIHEPFMITIPGPICPATGLHHLAPSPPLLEAAQQYLLGVNPEGLPHCGLHIRRGDYSTWLGGAFYYADDFWLDLARRSMAEQRVVSIFTNEPDSELSKSLAAMGAHVSGGSASEDLVRMMYMDSIVGPPSTFTLMALMLAQDCIGRQVAFEQLPEFAQVPSG